MGKRRTFYFDGLGVSAGVVIGPAYVLETSGFKIQSHAIPEGETAAEIDRFHQAVELARKEVQELGETVSQRIDPQQAAIFEAHLTLLSDPLLIDKTVQGIRESLRNAEFIFWSITKEIGDQLQALGDSYFSERSHDLYDVARRVLKFLEEIKNPSGAAMPEGSIIVANDLGPSDTALFHRDRVAGFVTDEGGPTSHTAIMAKALSLPAVVGTDFLRHYVRNGDRLIVDGSEGKVILNPTPEQVALYEERGLEFAKMRENYSAVRDLPAQGIDGIKITLEANIEFTNELSLVANQGAEGIGLFRTEYFFIERRTLPTEEEQEAAYRKVLEAMGDKPVVFRTLDVGGDKLANAVPTPPEGNPFLGLRAIRLCLAYPDLFRCQLRPLLRAGAGKTLNILLPMISNINEVRQARQIINDVYENLEQKGVALPAEIRIGVMIEIPSAALQAELLAKEADFFSIGTNDLVQYTLAVDRVNKMVGHLYTETHPAILQLIDHVVRVAEQTGTPLSVCGEMAGDPVMALMLIALGVKRLSMSPSLIAPVKKAIRAIEVSYLKEVADDLLRMATPSEVRHCFMEHLNAYPCSRPSEQMTSNQQREQPANVTNHDPHTRGLDLRQQSN